MKTDLRKNPERSLGRYWLAMSDAAAFRLVRTAIGIAEVLRRDLADQARVLAPLTPPEIALQLLTAAEMGWGKSKALTLMGQVAELRGHDGAARAKAWQLLRAAMTQMPTLLWPQEKLPGRRELIEELDRQAERARGELALLPSKTEQLEQQCRDGIAALRRPAPRRG